ncbi:hypothetical protein [Rhizobium sp. CF142]|uniref:hypothetical protein n=1 Tax=Rhizobium sp. CF142 TaxID=1144314 RepID=UPI00026EF21F|nr:hypothetical protein [Rhizobium sp. CF142]EJJ31381.1 hypothetical protein PMI11_00375 [Rhizobium sp. CF142]
MSTQTIPAKEILVFLPPASAQVVATKLAECGYSCTAVSTIPDVFDALRSDSYSLAITTRSEIDLLRNIRSIPVVNLEIFFHAEPSSDGPLFTSKRFDGKAFIQRVECLVRPISTRGEHAAVEPLNGAARADRPSRWWTRAKSLLGLPRRSAGTTDVRTR